LALLTHPDVSPVSPLQLAVECEQAKAKQGRGVLGELERSALGKGKMQAAAGARQPQHHHQQQQLLQQLQSSMSLSGEPLQQAFCVPQTGSSCGQAAGWAPRLPHSRATCTA
jgi:hypothetical protein